MSATAAAVMAASIRLVGSLFRMEVGEGPEEVMESTIWSAIAGLLMCRLGEMVLAETEVVNVAAGVTVKLSVGEWIWPGWKALRFYAKA